MGRSVVIRPPPSGAEPVIQLAECLDESHAGNAINTSFQEHGANTGKHQYSWVFVLPVSAELSGSKPCGIAVAEIVGNCEQRSPIVGIRLCNDAGVSGSKASEDVIAHFFIWASRVYLGVVLRTVYLCVSPVQFASCPDRSSAQAIKPPIHCLVLLLPMRPCLRWQSVLAPASFLVIARRSAQCVD